MYIGRNVREESYMSLCTGCTRKEDSEEEDEDIDVNEMLLVVKNKL